MNVLNGTSVNFRCTGNGNPSPNITWLFNGNPIPQQNLPELSILNVTLLNTGNYQCLFQNDAGSTASAIAVLIVYSKYTIIII